VEEETGSLKYAAINGTIRTSPAQELKHESIKNQCTQSQQLLRTASTSMRRVSTASAQSINKQSIQHQQAMHTASTTNVFCINSQCA